MSIEAMSACWGPHFPVHSTDQLSAPMIRLTAIAIADSVNDVNGNLFYGSLVNLAAKVGASRDTMRLVVKHLVESGVLSVYSKPVGKPIRYCWVWDAATAAPHTAPRGYPGGSEEDHPTDISAPHPTDQSAPTPRANPAPPRGLVRAEPNMNPTGTQVTTPTHASPDLAFDAFWEQYPRKLAKAEALKAWRRKLRTTPPMAIIDGLMPWVAYWRARNEPEFIPHPTTWLNQERWNDSPPPISAPRGRNAGIAGNQDIAAVREMARNGTLPDLSFNGVRTTIRRRTEDAS